MSRKLLYYLLGAEAALCVLFCLLSASFEGAFTAAMAFPMEQIGLGLRALSLWNRFGNGLALAIYAAVCLLPALHWARARARRGGRREDALLLLLSLLLFYAVYMMANPQKLPGVFNVAAMESGVAMAKAILGGAVYATLICYGLFRLLDALKSSGASALKRYLTPMLYALAALFVLSIFGGRLGEMLAALEAFRESNTGGHGFTELFIALRYIVEALPYGLSIVTVFLAADMLARMEEDGAVEAADKLSGWCVKSLGTTALVNTGYYLAQVFFAGSLRSIAGQVSLPLLSVTLTIAALLFARIVAENKRLKEDSDMII